VIDQSKRPPLSHASGTPVTDNLNIQNAERAGQRAAVAATKAAFQKAALPVIATETHILPVMVGDPDLCKQASDLLLDRHGVYIQPINYPTVPRGSERLRITPTPPHDVRLIGQLADAMVSVWQELDLPLGGDYQPVEQPARRIEAVG
jgi:5-aminolevulinate synthase